MDVPIIGNVVDFFLHALSYILGGIVGYRVFIAFQQDNDVQLWKAWFWGFIAFGLISKVGSVFQIFGDIWDDIIK
ncbi:hypothetical protein SAMN05444392_11662 [Seinonella peptonophila]|uniref:Uncharacterized protein n=1 Tax=Seinonella peptonophila TaxID=112248 RepID=A0A1M5AXQ0_9BACL|nr:hypothetical protein [Seinonella peptonophila]SHF34983.1 hypothetical protein SAMN05444392_11662 [Seinonella peptonophila]